MSNLSSKEYENIGRKFTSICRDLGQMNTFDLQRAGFLDTLRATQKFKLNFRLV